MTVEISILSQGILSARVTGASDDDDSQVIVDRLVDAARDGTAERALLDLSDQTSSTLNAAKARGVLSNLNSELAKAWGNHKESLSLAIAAPSTSFGYGIGRMISGHAYDLCRLQVEQFNSRNDALDWLQDAS